MLTEFYHKTPDAVTEDELREYFLHRKNVSMWAPQTMRICYCGIRFFYTNVLQHDWHIFNIIRAQTEHRLPSVLSEEEVRKILSCVNTAHNHAYLTTVYSCGLRLHEGLHLEVSDIDSSRKMLHVHRGKGAKDRYVPLPEATIDVLRRHWKTHRHPHLIFPAIGRNRKQASSTALTMAKSSVQQFLGHARLETTMVYLHLTNKGQQDAWQKINDLMKEL
jgi:integrase/recombinase XerD